VCLSVQHGPDKFRTGQVIEGFRLGTGDVDVDDLALSLDQFTQRIQLDAFFVEQQQGVLDRFLRLFKRVLSLGDLGLVVFHLGPQSGFVVDLVLHEGARHQVSDAVRVQLLDQIGQFALVVGQGQAGLFQHLLGFLLRLLGLTQGNIVSVSLVTPAAVGGDEKEMLANQVAAYERANLKFGDQGMEVRLPQPDGSFKTEFVKPNIVAFNAGVNSFSLGKLSPFFGGWGPSDRLNNQSFKALVGDLASGGALGGMAGEKVAALRQQLSDPAQAGQHMAIRQKIGVIQDLAGQIKDMLADGSHHSAGNEPYKFPVRLLALANECDASPAFNCKSGKDRTG